MLTEAARKVGHLRKTPSAALRELRRGFEQGGVDVSPYTDQEVAAALRLEAAASPFSDLLAGAFRRLQRSNHPRG